MVECCEQGLVGHPSRSLEDRAAGGHVASGGPAQEVQRETVLAARLETILVIVWQRIGLLFVSVLKKNE